MSNPTTTAASDVLSRARSHLEGAYQLACEAIGDDTLSPWANTAMSIHLASAGIAMHLEHEPVPSTEHTDCLAALRAAQAEMIHLPQGRLPLDDLTLIRTCLADVLAEAASLHDDQSYPQP